MDNIFWFRRDLRLQDNVALNEAISAAKNELGKVALCFSIEPKSFEKLSGVRQLSLIESAKALSDSVAGNLILKFREADDALVELAHKLKVKTVFATRAFDPAGIEQQNRVGFALQRLDDTLQALLKVTTVFGTGQQSAHVQ